MGFFKYFNFFADSTVQLFTFFGFTPSVFTLNILLPVGISFYTFQTMAYTIDVYRRKETACRNFIDFALYVAYFPQLVAGPIERSQNLLPRLQNPRLVSSAMIASACQLILMGYFKKIFIADGVAPIVNQCFDSPEKFGGLGLVFGAYLFAIQIYGDFSGYTDIARGVSRLFGIELMLNFRQPYLSSNITDFWRRWHISLSSWLRDYLYIPLGGNRRGIARTYANNMMTMLLGGLWHGASWNFVIWGGLHGLYLGVHKFMLGNRKADDSVPADFQARIGWLVCVVVTFHLVCFAWIFFRAPDLHSACRYIHVIWQFQPSGPLNLPLVYFLFYGTCMLIVDVLCRWQNSEVPVTNRWWAPVRGLAYASMIFLLCYIGETEMQPFIYFQF
ncbi:MAG TPA: hypothetical protein DEB39_04465 [Planctomycetaceae bacterium]|nr:hypothetical protein [Planctomycetaceae bacterium]